jgi:Fe-S-cluster-containing dehydrogenase component
MSGLSRRKFLAAGAAGVAAAGLCSPGKASAAARLEGYPEGMGVLVDFTKCVGCRSCEAACNKENGLPEPAQPFDDLSVFDQRSRNGQPRRPDENAFTVVNRYDTEGSGPVYRKIQCNHCNEPACLTSCFVNAYTKTKEGAVVYNGDVCVGCRMCMTACPFYVPGYSYSSAYNPLVVKCNFCHDKRLVNGRPPACVEACPQEALTFGHRKALIRIGHDRIRQNPDRYVNHIYGEKEAGGTAWMYLSNVPFEQLAFDTTLQTEPIINNVKDFLGMVPIVLGVWPALFAGMHLLATKGKDHGAAGHAESGEGEEE